MKEPGNLIFEFATAGPGFTIDESVDDLGRQLQLYYEDNHAIVHVPRHLVLTMQYDGRCHHPNVQVVGCERTILFSCGLHERTWQFNI
jgi:hypothetical protein